MPVVLDKSSRKPTKGWSNGVVTSAKVLIKPVQLDREPGGASSLAIG